MIEGVLAIIRHHKGFEIYNLGESQTTSPKELIGLIEEPWGRELRLKKWGFNRVMSRSPMPISPKQREC